MKFKVDRASDTVSKIETVRIGSLEELMEFVEKNGSIVIWGDEVRSKTDITIYDGYIE